MSRIDPSSFYPNLASHFIFQKEIWASSLIVLLKTSLIKKRRNLMIGYREKLITDQSPWVKKTHTWIYCGKLLSSMNDSICNTCSPRLCTHTITRLCSSCKRRSNAVSKTCSRLFVVFTMISQRKLMLSSCDATSFAPRTYSRPSSNSLPS